MQSVHLSCDERRQTTLYPVTQSNDKVFYQEFDEVHYGLWVKVLTDEEYHEIVDDATDIIA